MYKNLQLGEKCNLRVDFDSDAFELAQSILARGDKLGVACSGGADSVFLLLSLLAVFGEFKDSFVVLHFNHKIRENAEIDERFVRDLCARLNVQVVFGYPEKTLKHSESDFRQARMTFFKAQAKALKLGAVAQGHHLGDVAETLIMRLMRGSGCDGLCAPRSVSRLKGVCFIRPLLKLTKGFMMSALESVGQDWREDESNAECDFLRNKVRNILLPELEKISPSDFLGSAGRTRMLLQEDSDFIDSVLFDELEAENADISSTQNNLYMKIGGFVSENIALLRRAVLKFLAQNSLLDSFRTGALDAFLKPILSGKSAVASVGNYTLRFNVADYSLSLEKNVKVETFEMPLLFGKNTLPDNSIINVKKVRMSPAKKDAILAGENDDSKHVYLDPDAIGGDFEKPRLIVRTKQDGDRYAPIGASSPKKLKELFNAKKIPLMKRKRAVLVCNAKGEILWSPGLAPAKKYALSKGFTALELTFTQSDV